MIVLNCPHCGKTQTVEAGDPTTLVCRHCGESFISMGRLPNPDWTIDLGPRQYNGSVKATFLPTRACAYCGRFCGKQDVVCSRCSCDLQQVATLNLKHWVMQLEVEPDAGVISAYLALAYLDISENEALLRLWRLHPRIAREMGATVALAESMAYLEPPPRRKPSPRNLAKNRPEAWVAPDEGWQDEALGAPPRGAILYLFTLGALFYVLSMVLGIGSLVAGFLLAMEEGLEWIEGSVFLLVAGAALLLGTLPRFDRFRPPGPELNEADYPRLFTAIREVAAKLGHGVPASVYVMPEVDIFVGFRGGMLGFGGKQVMGLGWPFLQALTISEFKAILAHEMGHFDGRDSAFGPRIYRIREALGRLVIRFEEEADPITRLSFSFFSYLFIEHSAKVARRQEYHADALAAQLYGPSVLITGLNKKVGAREAFDFYDDDEIAPILEMGLRVPVINGFAKYLASGSQKEELLTARDFSQCFSDAHAFENHPPTGYRVSNVLRFADPKTATEDGCAAILLGDLTVLEQAMLSFHSDEAGVLDFPLVLWDELGERFYVPYWQGYLHQFRARFEGLCLGDLPRLYRDPEPLVAGWDIDLRDKTQDEMADLLMYPFRSALGVALSQRGWRVQAVPGERLRAVKEGTFLDLYDVVNQVRLDADDPLWAEVVVATGLATVKLTDLADPEQLDNHRKRKQLQTKKPPLRALFEKGYGSILGWCVSVGWTLALGLVFSDTEIGKWSATFLFYLPFAVATALPLRQFLMARRGIGHWVMDDRAVTFTEGRQSTTIDFIDIERLRMRRVTVGASAREAGTWWTIVITSARATVHISHFREAGRRGRLAEEMIHELGIRHAEIWRETIEDGGRVVGKGWEADNDGLRVGTGSTTIPWHELAKPEWFEDLIVIHRRNQVEPVLALPHQVPEALTLYWLGRQLAHLEGPTSALGPYKAVARRRNGFGVLMLGVFSMIGLFFGLMFFGQVKQAETGDFYMPLFVSMTSMGLICGIAAVVIRFRGKIYLYENGVRLRGLFRTQSLSFDQLTAARYTCAPNGGKLTTVWLRSARVAMKFKYGGLDDPFIEAIVQESAKGVARNAFGPVLRGQEWHWTGKLYISREGLVQKGRKPFKIPLRHVDFDQEEDGFLVFHDADHETFAYYRPNDENGLAGVYLVRLLQEAAES